MFVPAGFRELPEELVHIVPMSSNVASRADKGGNLVDNAFFVMTNHRRL